MEILIAGIWFMTLFLKSVIYAYCFVKGLAQLLESKDYRPILLPCGMILMACSLIVYPDVVYMLDFDSTVYIPYSIVIGLFLPLLLPGAGLIRRKFNN